MGLMGAFVRWWNSGTRAISSGPGTQPCWSPCRCTGARRDGRLTHIYVDTYNGTRDILTMASQQGGAGNTMLTAHLAVEAERTSAGPVAVVETKSLSHARHGDARASISKEPLRWPN